MINLRQLPALDGVTYGIAVEQDLAKYALSPEEEIDLFAKGSSSEKRIRDFTLGRLAARKALVAFGIADPQPVRRGERGEPIWPLGVVGSITHTGKIGVAICASNQQLGGIGIDLEQRSRELDFNIADYIATSDEQEWIKNANQHERALLLFCAKESIYKALAPIVKRFIGFKEVELKFVDQLQCNVFLKTTELDKFKDKIKVYPVIHETIIGAITTVK